MPTVQDPDVTDEIEELDASLFNAFKAERKGLNVLIMRRLDKPFKRFDGKTAVWELEYRWLSRVDPECVCVRGNEFTYWRSREWCQEKSLFEQFSLTG